MITVAESDCEWYSAPYLDSHHSRQPVLRCYSQRIIARGSPCGVFPGHISHWPPLAPVVSRALPTQRLVFADVDSKKPRLRKSRSKDIAIHCCLAGPFQPTEPCMESWCTSAFYPWLVASDRSDLADGTPTTDAGCGFRNSQLQGPDLLVRSPSFPSFSQSLMFLPGFDHNGY